MTSLGTTLLIRTRIKSPATLATRMRRCPLAPPPKTQTPVLRASRSFVMHVPVHFAPVGKGRAKTGRATGLEMRPARLRRNQGRLTAEHYPFAFLVCIFSFLFSPVTGRLQGCITHNLHTHNTCTAYAHTCLICAGRAANRATSSAKYPLCPIAPNGWWWCLSHEKTRRCPQAGGTSSSIYRLSPSHSYVRLIITQVA